jgi:hypothetical protein
VDKALQLLVTVTNLCLELSKVDRAFNQHDYELGGGEAYLSMVLCQL